MSTWIYVIIESPSELSNDQSYVGHSVCIGCDGGFIDDANEEKSDQKLQEKKTCNCMQPNSCPLHRNCLVNDNWQIYFIN